MFFQLVFFFKQKTAYEMRISDWSSDVCSSDLKKALFIINSLAGGGAERVMATLLHASAEWRDRYDISLALLDREDAAYATPRRVDNIQFDCHGRLLPSGWALRRLIYRIQPDAALGFLTRATFANITATVRQIVG